MDAQGKSGFPKAGRTIEEHVREGRIPLAGRIDGNAQALADLALADHLAHPLRAEIRIVGFARGIRGDDSFAGHGNC
jgi:hypothetical protein